MSYTIRNADDMRVWVNNQITHSDTAWKDLRALRDRLVTDVVQQVGNVAVKRELITVINQGLNELQAKWKEEQYAA